MWHFPKAFVTRKLDEQWRDERSAKATIVGAPVTWKLSAVNGESHPHPDLVRKVHGKLCAHFQIAYGETPLEPLDMSFKSFVDTHFFKKTYEIFRLFDQIGCIRWSNLVVERFCCKYFTSGKELRNLIRKDLRFPRSSISWYDFIQTSRKHLQSVDGNLLSKTNRVGLIKSKFILRP